MKRLLKRTESSAKVSKPSPAPEPETFTEKGSTNVAEKTQPMLGKCLKCENHAHSEADHLCYGCRMLAEELEYDTDKNRYTTSKRRK